jgi:predicted metal-dependent phosphoesterase TrpH
LLIDLHNHTLVSSPCSRLSTEEFIETARLSGLDGVCVTDHLFIEGAELAQAYGRKVDYPVFRGIEARSQLGDMLVFGYYKDIPEGISLDDLCWYVHEAGGVVFAAHPFHTAGGANLYASLQAQGLDLETDWHKVRILGELDGVEILNGQVDDRVNAKASWLAHRLNRPGIGGSDAHAVAMVGKAATRFSHLIRTDEELVAALRSGDYKPVRLRD